MKVTHLLLCSLIMLNIAACKKKSMPVKQTVTVLADSPNVANDIDSVVVASHFKTDTFTGPFSDVEGISGGWGNTIFFYVQYIRPGMAIISTNTPLQTEDIPYKTASVPQPFHTTIAYYNPGDYYYKNMKISIADSLIITWTYVRVGLPDDHIHNCSFRGGRIR